MELTPWTSMHNRAWDREECSFMRVEAVALFSKPRANVCAAKSQAIMINLRTKCWPYSVDIFEWCHLDLCETRHMKNPLRIPFHVHLRGWLTAEQISAKDKPRTTSNLHTDKTWCFHCKFQGSWRRCCTASHLVLLLRQRVVAELFDWYLVPREDPVWQRNLFFCWDNVQYQLTCMVCVLPDPVWP